MTALSLVAQLCRKRKAASLPPCLEFCRDRFAAFEAGSESPSALDGALFLFGSLGAHFADAKAPPRPRASPALAPRLGAPRPFMALFVSVHGAGASVLSIHGAVRVRSRRRRVRLGRRRRRARPPSLVAEMLVQRVAPQLRAQQAHLRGRACWVLGNFADFIAQVG